MTTYNKLINTLFRYIYILMFIVVLNIDGIDVHAAEVIPEVKYSSGSATYKKGNDYDDSIDFTYKIGDTDKTSANDSNTAIIKTYYARSDKASIPGILKVKFNSKTYELKVTEIGDGTNCALSTKSTILNIKIDGNIKKINSYAFYNCSSIRKVEIDSSNITDIGDYAFYGCTGLCYREAFDFAAFDKSLTGNVGKHALRFGGISEAGTTAGKPTVHLSQSAEQTSSYYPSDGIAKVTMNISADSSKSVEGSDYVICLDVTGSMDNNGYCTVCGKVGSTHNTNKCGGVYTNQWDAVKQSLYTFAETVMNNNSKNRIAIVVFMGINNSDGTSYNGGWRSLYFTSNKSTILNTISNLKISSTNGGVIMSKSDNMSAGTDWYRGIIAACITSQLRDLGTGNRHVNLVFMSDGEPNQEVGKIDAISKIAHAVFDNCWSLGVMVGETISNEAQREKALNYLKSVATDLQGTLLFQDVPGNNLVNALNDFLVKTTVQSQASIYKVALTSVVNTSAWEILDNSTEYPRSPNISVSGSDVTASIDYVSNTTLSYNYYVKIKRSYTNLLSQYGENSILVTEKIKSSHYINGGKHSNERDTASDSTEHKLPWWTTKVTIDANGGVASPSEYIGSYGKETTIANPTPPEWHRFKDWTFNGNTSNGCSLNGSKYTFGTSDSVLKANYYEDTFHVYYYGNGATSGSISTQDFKRGETVTIKSNENGFIRDGWVFVGWKSSSGTEYAIGSTYGTGVDLHLYAQWKQLHLLTVDPNRGTWNGKSSKSTFKMIEGQTLEMPAPLRNKYKFMGWSVWINKPTISIDGNTFSLLDDNYNNTGKYLYMLDGDIGNRPFVTKSNSYYDKKEITIHDFTKEFGARLKDYNNLVSAYKPYNSKEEVYAFILSKEDEMKYLSKINGYEHWVREDAFGEPLLELKHKQEEETEKSEFEKIEKHCGKCGSKNVNLEISKNAYIRYKCSDCTEQSYTYIIKDAKNLICTQDNKDLVAVDGDNGIYKCEDNHYHIIYSCPSCNSHNTKVDFLNSQAAVELSCYDCGDIFKITSSNETKTSDGDDVTCAYCDTSDKLSLEFGTDKLYPRYKCANSYEHSGHSAKYTYIIEDASNSNMKCSRSKCDGSLESDNNSHYTCNKCNYRYAIYKCPSPNCKSSRTAITNKGSNNFTLSCYTCGKDYRIAQEKKEVCSACKEGSIVYICSKGKEEVASHTCYLHKCSAHEECNNCHVKNPTTTTKYIITETEVEPLKYAYCSNCYHTEFECNKCGYTWYGSKQTKCTRCNSTEYTYCIECGKESNYDINTIEQKYSALYCDICESTEHINTTSYTNYSACTNNGYDSHRYDNKNLVVITPSNNVKYTYTYYYTENNYSTSYKNEIKETTKTESHYIRPVILLDVDTSCLPSLTEDTIFTMPDYDITLTAQWAIPHNLRIDPNKGIWNGKSEVSDIVLGRGETRVIKAPERKGYTFDNWSKTIGKNTYEDKMEIDTYKFSLLDKNYNSTGNALYIMESPLGSYKYFVDDNESVNTVARDLGVRLKELSKDRDIASKKIESEEKVYSFILNENEANNYKSIVNLKDSWIRKETAFEPIVSEFGELTKYTALTPHCGACDSANIHYENSYIICEDCNEKTSIIKDTNQHVICSECSGLLDKVADKETYKCSNNHYNIILSCPDCNSHNTRIVDKSSNSLTIGCYDCGHEHKIITTTKVCYVCSKCKNTSFRVRCKQCGRTLTLDTLNNTFKCENCKHTEYTITSNYCPKSGCNGTPYIKYKYSTNIEKLQSSYYECNGCHSTRLSLYCNNCRNYFTTDTLHNGTACIYCGYSNTVLYCNDCGNKESNYYKCNDCTSTRVRLRCNSCRNTFEKDTLRNGTDCYCGSSNTIAEFCCECISTNISFIENKLATLHTNATIFPDADIFTYCNNCYKTQFKCSKSGETWDGVRYSSCTSHSLISDSYCINCGEESSKNIELIHRECSALYCKNCDNTNVTKVGNIYECSICRGTDLTLIVPNNNSKLVAYYIDSNNEIVSSSAYKNHMIIPAITVSTDYGQLISVNKDTKEHKFTMGNVDNTLTANWTPNNYKLTLDPNDGVLSGESEYTLKFDSPDNNNISGSTVTRENYDFDGWYTEKQGGVKVYDIDGNCTNDGTYWKDGKCAYDGDYTLYARWAPITYYVRLYKNQPPVASSKVEKASSDDTWANNDTYYEKQFKYDETTVPSLDFYSLTGWHTEGDNWYTQGNEGTGFGGSIASGSKNLTKVKNDTVSLYPNWIRNKYTIKYDGNNTTYNIHGDKCSTTYTGNTISTSYLYDTEATIASNGFSKVGYKFKYWNTQSDGKGTTYTQGQKVKNLTTENNGVITLYAIWEPILYEIEFNGNDNFNANVAGVSYRQQMRYDSSAYLLPNKFTRQNNYNWNGTQIGRGYTFLGWVKAEGNDDTTRKADANKNYEATYLDKQSVINLSSVDNSTVYLYAMWEKKDIELTFNLNGGKYANSGGDIKLYGTIWNMQKAYTFSINSTKTPANTPLYSVQTNSIDAFGISDSDGFNNKYTKSVNGIAYRFLGWSRTEGATVPDSDLHVLLRNKPSVFTVVDNTTLYAVWEPVLQSRVTLNRSLGNLQFINSGTSYSVINDTGSITAQTLNPELVVIVRPGEQGQYEIFNTVGNTDVTIEFDGLINKMYDEPGIWTDSLNPSTNEDWRKTPPQSNGLNRQINNNTSYLLRKFYMPQYIGTSQSHPGVKADNYSITFTLKSSSWFYAAQGKEEKIVVKAKIYIQNEVGKDVVSVLDELRTRLKIRIKDNN